MTERLTDPLLQLRHVLEGNGATYAALNPTTTRIDNITNFTHIIATTSDFPDYFLALDHFVHVVKPSWVDDSLRRGKTVNPRSHSPDPSFFMSDFIVTCAKDIPEGDQEAIIGGVLAMGGHHGPTVTKLTTHIVALSLANDKCELARAKNLRCKIVLPHWFVSAPSCSPARLTDNRFDDCLKLGKKIDETPYLLPNPPILSRDTSGPIVHHPSRAIKGATSPVPVGLPSPVSFSTPNATRTLGVFSGKNIMLSQDLNISSHIRQTIEELIRTNGGTVTTDVDEADTYVCAYRDGEDYLTASRAGKDVGNLAWLYYLITHNLWTWPMRRLLHYPVPRNGIPGFEEYAISISNYVGDARIYLENLAKACGAQFTRHFRQDNTHLVTAHSQSEKCTAAKEWGVHLVNHMWLEESYAKCKEQSLTNTRYTHFPARTNLGEVVGHTQIDREAVEKYFFKPVAAQKPKKAAQGSKPNLSEVRNTLTGKDMVVASRTPQTTEGGSPTQAAPFAKKAIRGKTDSAELQTPGRVGGGKENETPSTGRGAKSKALSKLHNLAPDIAQYEKESKRKGGVIYGGRRISDAAEREKIVKEIKAGKRKLELDDDDDAESAEKATGRKAKKAKSQESSLEHFLMLSGDNRWVDKPKKEGDDKVSVVFGAPILGHRARLKADYQLQNKLRALGIHVTQTPEEVTILCAPRIVRTKKFVAALSNAPAVVTTKFLDQCLKTKKVPSLEDYTLNDEEGEKKQGIKLRDTIIRAEQNHRQLLDGWQIFVTEKVNGGFETFKDIITANGGTCIQWKGRATAVSKRKKGDTAMGLDPASSDELELNRANDEGDTLYLISSVETEDVKLWSKFRDMAKKADMRPRIVKPDWILLVALSQMIQFDDRWELTDDDARSAKSAKR